MHLLYSALLVLLVTLSSAVPTTGNEGTCVNPSTLTFIENSLSNISAQLKGFGSSYDGSTGDSLTSLLQLTLLKELVRDCKEKSCNDGNEEGLALLKRIELILNTSTVDLTTRLSAIERQVPSAISSLQSQVSSLSADNRRKVHLLLLPLLM